jgi:molecular chaperone DnaJ
MPEQVQGGDRGLRGALRTVRSARPTTASATPGSIPPWVAVAAVGGGSFSDIFGDVFGDIFGGGGRGGRGGPRRSAARTCATPWISPSRTPCAARRWRSACPRSSPVRPATAAAPRAAPDDLRHLRRRRPGAHAAGFLPGAADLPDLSRSRHASSPIPAPSCHGQGRVEKTKTLSVKVPPGVDTGDRIRLVGRGRGGPGWRARRRPVRADVGAQHPIFERDGKHLYCEVPITFVDAALGGELEVPTLDGRVKLKIPRRPRPASCSACAARASSRCAAAAWATCCAAPWWRPRSISTSEQKEPCCSEFEDSLGQGGHAQSPRQSSWFEGVKNFFEDMKP